MRIAIVVPRYGTEIGAGAETQARGFAEAAAARGWTVEVWTTCVRNHYTWNNDLPPGRTELNGVVIQRFRMDAWNPGPHAKLAQRLANHGTLLAAEQAEWLATAAHSSALYGHVARHAATFDACVMLPYAMPLIHYAAWSAPQQTILWPCLHDEAYARLEVARLLLESTWGVMFNTPEEQNLAVDELGMQPQRQRVLGEGIEWIQPTVAVPLPNDSFDQNLLYVGRLEGGKNLALLYKYVRRYVESGNQLRLVVIGTGPMQPPKHPAFHFRGFVDDVAKMNACATALALCQPSYNESFSRVIMEAWLAERPVLVHDNCAVTRGHVQRSKGGSAFRTYPEFAEVVDWLKANPTLAAQMGRNGRAYVLQNYTWPLVVERFAATVTAWKQAV